MSRVETPVGWVIGGLLHFTLGSTRDVSTPAYFGRVFSPDAETLCGVATVDGSPAHSLHATTEYGDTCGACVTAGLAADTLPPTPADPSDRR